MTEALWQVGELPHLGSLAVQGQNLSDRSAESLQNGFTQILNGLEVKGLWLPMFFTEWWGKLVELVIGGSA